MARRGAVWGGGRGRAAGGLRGPRVAATPGAPASILCEGMPRSLARSLARPPSRGRGGGGGSGAAPSRLPTWSPAALGIAGPGRGGGGGASSGAPRRWLPPGPQPWTRRDCMESRPSLEFGSLWFWARVRCRPSCWSWRGLCQRRGRGWSLDSRVVYGSGVWIAFTMIMVLGKER